MRNDPWSDVGDEEVADINSMTRLVDREIERLNIIRPIKRGQPPTGSKTHYVEQRAIVNRRQHVIEQWNRAQRVAMDRIQQRRKILRDYDRFLEMAENNERIARRFLAYEYFQSTLDDLFGDRFREAVEPLSRSRSINLEETS